jgi:hypothetical protein
LVTHIVAFHGADEQREIGCYTSCEIVSAARASPTTNVQ